MDGVTIRDSVQPVINREIEVYIMGNITVIFSVSVLIESVVEYIKSMASMLQSGNKEDIKKALTQLATICLGVGIAFLFGLKLFEIVGANIDPVADKILTGITCSRGSNFVSDLLSKLNGGTIMRSSNQESD